MRRTVFLGFIISLCVAVALFQLKYQVAEQERQLTTLSNEIYQTEEAIHILQAEWSYLNEPGRLQMLAEKHLSLAPAETVQLVSYDNVGKLYQNHIGTVDERLVVARYEKK